MYSRLNVIVNELNALGLTKVSNTDVVRKMISLLPHDKYASIITILHNPEEQSDVVTVI
jgi:hypothetical protein